MSQFKSVVLLGLAVAAAASSVRAADSVTVSSTFTSATTLGGQTLFQGTNQSAVPQKPILTFVGANGTKYVYSSLQAGVYSVDYSFSSSTTSGGFGSVAFGELATPGLVNPSSGTLYTPSSSPLWFTATANNQSVLVNQNNPVNVSLAPTGFTDLQNIAASFGPVPSSPTTVSSQDIGSVRVQWDGVTAATLKLGDATADGTLGAIQFDTSNTSTGVLNPQQFGPSAATIQFTPLLPGDTDGDGNVNFNDLTTLLRNFNATDSSWADGNFSGGTDPKVDFNDLTILLRNFNTSWTTGLGAGGSVVAAVAETPEPASLTLLGLGAGSLLASRRRKNR